MSDWKRGAAARRDARATKTPEDVRKLAAAIVPLETTTLASSARLAKKKNTKRWCRGKAGVGHKLRCVDYVTTKFVDTSVYTDRAKSWKILICEVCGKELDRYWPMQWGDRPLPSPPPWVTE
jgi:hypothetical protein